VGSPFPALFVSHGSPDMALRENGWTQALRRFGASRRPRAAIVVSAHWEERAPLRLTGAERPRTIHDFSGFSPELSQRLYDCPGDPELARRAARLLEEDGLPAAVDPNRGLDHGAWVPLSFLFPEADVPVVQLSLPRPRDPGQIQAVGRALARLREEGILLLGSGGVVHNLWRLRMGDLGAPIESWASEFDSWVGDRLAAFDVAALRQYRQAGPHGPEAAPTTEHFDPIFFPLGAARPGDRYASLFEGFEMGSLSLRAFALAAA
jgi:4,5-DOPA dioxygenase extradiol